MIGIAAGQTNPETRAALAGAGPGMRASIDVDLTACFCMPHAGR